jgi:hypothetical protein
LAGLVLSAPFNPRNPKHPSKPPTSHSFKLNLRTLPSSNGFKIRQESPGNLFNKKMRDIKWAFIWELAARKLKSHKTAQRLWLLVRRAEALAKP